MQLSELGCRLIHILADDRNRFLPGVHVGYTNPSCSRRISRRETTRLVRNPSRTGEPLLRHQHTGLVLPLSR